MSDHVKRALGSKAAIATQRSGTIVALVPGDREAVERAARELVQRTEATAPAALACGMIAFPPAGPPLASPIPAPVLDAEPGTPVLA